jgi:uncharacterized membrane protein
VLGQFDLSFDPSHDSSGSVNVAYLNGLNPGAIGPVAYSYGASSDSLIVGGGSPFVVAGGTDDFFFEIFNLATSPTLQLFGYSTSSDSFNVYETNVGSVHVAVSATPIPAALPLFLSALGGLGFVGWRRSRAHV